MNQIERKESRNRRMLEKEKMSYSPESTYLFIGIKINKETFVRKLEYLDKLSYILIVN